MPDGRVNFQWYLSSSRCAAKLEPLSGGCAIHSAWTDSGTLCEGVECRGEEATRPCVRRKVLPHAGVGRGVLRVRGGDTLRFLGRS